MKSQALATLLLILSASIAWLFWGLLYHFLLSLIPATAEYGWIGKILITIIVGWMGGIAVPLILLVAAITIYWEMWR